VGGGDAWQGSAGTSGRGRRRCSLTTGGDGTPGGLTSCWTLPLALATPPPCPPSSGPRCCCWGVLLLAAVREALRRRPAP